MMIAFTSNGCMNLPTTLIQKKSKTILNMKKVNTVKINVKNYVNN